MDNLEKETPSIREQKSVRSGYGDVDLANSSLEFDTGFAEPEECVVQVDCQQTSGTFFTSSHVGVSGLRPSLQNLSPIPKSSFAKSRFGRKLREFNVRGESPLTRQRSCEQEIFLTEARRGTFRKPILLAEKSGSNEGEGDVRSFPSSSESGYSSCLKHLQPSNSNFGDTSSMTDSYLKVCQLQGTSTPRSRLPNGGSGLRNSAKKPQVSEEGFSYSTSCATTNPFDSRLLESLHKHTFSPSVFAHVVSPDKEQENTPSRPTDFRWSIDHIAVLNPAEIDEFPVQQASLDGLDPDTEAKIQNVIETFWSSQEQIAPSPLDQEVSRARVPLVKNADGCAINARKANVNVGQEESRDKITQTFLTFPPNLDLVKLLGGCFVYNEDTESLAANSVADVNLSVNSLRRKLFSCEEETPPPGLSEPSFFIPPSPENDSNEFVDDFLSDMEVGRRSSVDRDDMVTLISPELSPIRNV